MKKVIPLLILILFFLIFKLVNNGIRLSDTNIYFNVSHQIFQGKLIYRDIPFFDFPLHPYMSFIYYLLSVKNIEFFYFTSTIEISIITTLIYLIVYKKTKDHTASITSSLLYIFSFMVLSTSDHQTGVFTASLLAVLGFYFLKEKVLLSGILIAASFLTKAYLLPIALSFYGYLFIKRSKEKIIKFSIGFVLASILILLPFLLLAPKEFLSDIFGFSLTRPTGLSKINIMWFFITKDFPLFILLIFNLLNIKRNILFGLISIFSIVFFFAYQDIYYLYLNFLTPFLCISFYELYYFLKKNLNIQKMVIPTVILVFILYNLFTYLSFYKDLGKLEDINKLTKTIIEEKPDYLYGVNDITPALTAITNIPALADINDTHEYLFTRKIYDKEYLTNKAIRSKTIIITHGADYPQYNIKQDILDNIFVKETIYKNCKIIQSTKVLSEGDGNRINLFKCY